MSQYTSYYLYQRYESISGSTPTPSYPPVYSYNGQGTMTPIVKMDNDPNCGYVPPLEPIYRWYQLPITKDYICEECGETPIEPIYRWMNSGTTCIAYDKYQRAVKQVSNDNGATWEIAIPLQYSATTLIETNSEDCGYTPPMGNKLTVNYFDGTSESILCNSSNILGRCEDVVPNFNVTGVTSATIGDCVTTLNASFGDCINISSVTIPDSVIQIGGTVFENTALTGITLPSGLTTIGFNDPVVEDVPSVLYGGMAFSRCKNLKTINLPSSLTNLEYLTFWDSGLESISIPSSIGVIQYGTFGFCSGLTSVTISNGITAIGEKAFLECRNLSGITIPSSVTTIGKLAFANCYNLSGITIPSNITEIKEGTFSACYRMSGITIPDSVTSIGKEAFGGCSGLTTVSIPSTVDTIGEGAFWTNNGMIGLPCEVTINRTTPPTLGDHVFCSTRWYSGDTSYCDLNFRIYVPSGSVDTYKAAWTEYEDIIYPIGYVPPVEYGLTVYYSDHTPEDNTLCSTLPMMEDDNLRQLTRDFTRWTYTPSAVTIGNCVGEINYRVFSTYFNQANTAITTVQMGNNVKSIGTDCFYGCSSLSSITLSNSLIGIESHCFQNCTNLQTINIPDSVDYIQTNAFSNCSGLTSVSIGSGCTYIGSSAFSDCRSVEQITVNASTPPTLGLYAFKNCNNLEYIFVPSGSVDTYKEAERWSGYSSIIYPIGYVPGLEYRWVDLDPSTDYYCSGTTKYYKQQKQVSYDYGSTWENVNPAEYQWGSSAQTYSTDCGYIPPIGRKWLATYADSHTESAECDSSSAITYGEITKNNLVSLEIGDCVTEIESIILQNCGTITSVTISRSVTVIGNNAFYYCSNLASITCLATTPPTVERYTFYTDNTCPIYVPAESVEVYKSTGNWIYVESRIQAIP